MARAIPELMQVDESERDIAWLQESLQNAVKLEFSTIPLYLSALWTIKDPPPTPNPPAPPAFCNSAYGLIRGIVVEEMLHFGLACNMLTTLGDTPDIVGAVPSYPSMGLPGGVEPELPVALAGLTLDRVENLFMKIEYPEGGPVSFAAEETYPSIGAFYDAIQAAFTQLQPPVTGARQLTAATFDNYGCIGVGTNPEPLIAINTPNDFVTAITTIKEQGEGTSQAPDAPDFNDELAHYYKFGSIFNGKLYVQTASGWSYTGTDVPFPDVWPMAEAPAGGYPNPPANVQAALDAFNQQFSAVVDNLQAAWTNGSNDSLNDAIGIMFQLAQLAQAILQLPGPDPSSVYGPTFQYVAGSS